MPTITFLWRFIAGALLLAVAVAAALVLALIGAVLL
jgi:hypothetical protein